MTIVDARLATDDFDMTDGGTIDYASFKNQSADRMFLQRQEMATVILVSAYGGPVPSRRHAVPP